MGQGIKVHNIYDNIDSTQTPGKEKGRFCCHKFTAIRQVR